ncbi:MULTISPECIES: cysteine-rich CWC family protein [Ramlibacter]|uniref:Cysteine-rich CWC family protein n=1 Tax=Ramlibacter aquaticus TaxID=2780094 RepID=A0ABR9SDR6_9BURK|nr:MULTISPECIES: cysteine-rich CWC family protein [Ramlibacter]MBE7940430.1 cysteine-rich CWC family protein [Ramlibacter aquaticus]
MTPDLRAPADPRLCPLCGQPNQCAAERRRETGQPQAPCWCVSAHFPPELLARVPADARDRACICPACAGQAA